MPVPSMWLCLQPQFLLGVFFGFAVFLFLVARQYRVALLDVLLALQLREPFSKPRRASTPEEELLESASISSGLSSAQISEEVYRSTWLQVGPVYRVCSISAKAPGEGTPEGMFFVVLKNQYLFFYSDERQCECLAALWIEECTVNVDPMGVLRPDEIFHRDFPVQLRSKKNATLFGLGRELYIHFTSNLEKEQWLFAFLKAKNQNNFEYQQESERLHLSIRRYFSQLKKYVASNIPDDSSGELRVVNLLAGRLFFNIFQSGVIEDAIHASFKRTMELAAPPSFLGAVSITEISIGDHLPLLTGLRMHRMSDGGECSFYVDVSFQGAIRIEVETSIDLSKVPVLSTLSARTIPIVVAVQMLGFSGQAIVSAKAPPSDRLWLCFVKKPDLEIKIQPTVSTTAIRMELLVSFLEGRIKGAIHDAVVFPAMIDVPSVPFQSRRFKSLHQMLTQQHQPDPPHVFKPPVSLSESSDFANKRNVAQSALLRERIKAK